MCLVGKSVSVENPQAAFKRRPAVFESLPTPVICEEPGESHHIALSDEGYVGTRWALGTAFPQAHGPFLK